MSWGLKITILYISFVVFILGLVMLTMRQKVDLVAEDYYAQELKFQEKIEKLKRANLLLEPLQWKVENKQVQINFPAEFKNKKISGVVNLFRPSDASLDKVIKIQSDTSRSLIIDVKDLTSGAYKLQIDWQVENTKYYNEGVIRF